MGEDFAMMGVLEAPARLFYDFDLEAQVPTDHMLRQIDRFLDVGAVREVLNPVTATLAAPRLIQNSSCGCW